MRCFLRQRQPVSLGQATISSSIASRLCFSDNDSHAFRCARRGTSQTSRKANVHQDKRSFNEASHRRRTSTKTTHSASFSHAQNPFGAEQSYRSEGNRMKDDRARGSKSTHKPVHANTTKTTTTATTTIAATSAQETTQTAFHGYLRSLNDPFTAAASSSFASSEAFVNTNAAADHRSARHSGPSNGAFVSPLSASSPYTGSSVSHTTHAHTRDCANREHADDAGESCDAYENNEEAHDDAYMAPPQSNPYTNRAPHAQHNTNKRTVSDHAEASPRHRGIPKHEHQTLAYHASLHAPASLWRRAHDDKHVHQLRENQQSILHRRATSRSLHELTQALGVLQEAEMTLFRFVTTKRVPRLAEHTHTDAHKEANEKEETEETASAGSSSSFRLQRTGLGESQEETARRYRVDALLFERVGQIKNTLRPLQAQHFQAAAAAVSSSSSSSSKTPSRHRQSNVLLEFVATVVRLLTYLSHTSQHATAGMLAELPTQLSLSGHKHASYVFLPGLVPPQHVETSIRNSDCLFALRSASRTLAELDNDTLSACMAFVIQHGVQPSSSSSSSPSSSSASSSKPWLLLRSADVFIMLDAALSLPSDDALHVPALVPVAPTPTSTSTPLSDSSARAIALWQRVDVSLEEWCVHRWIYFQTLVVRLLESELSRQRDERKTRQDTASRTRKKEEKEENVGSSPPGMLSTVVQKLLPPWLRAQALTPQQWIAVIRTCMSANEDPSNLMLRATTTSTRLGSRGGGSRAPRPDRHALRIPYGVGKTMTSLLLQYLKERSELWNEFHARVDETDSTPIHLNDLHVRDIATLCSAVLFFDVLTTEALHVLVQAAPRCVDAVGQLRGWEVSDMLLAYASLRFCGDVTLPSSPSSPVNFYLALGTRAGELGDSLSVEDTTRVLRALEMTGIDHDTLRKSFESSLRMRAVTRRQHLV